MTILMFGSTGYRNKNSIVQGVEFRDAAMDLAETGASLCRLDDNF